MAFSNLTRKQFQDLFDVIVGDATVNPNTALANGTSVEVNVTVTGARLGDIVLSAPGVDILNLTYRAVATANDNVSVLLSNNSGDHIADIASSTWNFVLLRPRSSVTSF